MFNLGITLLILGFGGALLPKAGFQFRILSAFGDDAPIIGGLLAVVGVILIVISASNSHERNDELTDPSKERMLHEMPKLEPFVQELVGGTASAQTDEDLKELIKTIATKADVGEDTVRLLLVRLAVYIKSQNGSQTASDVAD